MKLFKLRFPLLLLLSFYGVISWMFFKEHVKFTLQPVLDVGTGSIYTEAVSSHRRNVYITTLLTHRPTKSKRRDITCGKECVRNHNRLTSLREFCTKINESPTTSITLEKFLRIYPRKINTSLLYCTTYKIASTFMTRTLAILSGLLTTKQRDPFSLTQSVVRNLPMEKIPFNRNGRPQFIKSFNFLITRDPYSRLLSFYVDKLFSVNCYYWGEVGKVVVNNTRVGGERESNGDDVTFDEFIRHVVITEKSGISRNEHWYPVFEACRPCRIRYDFVGKIETFSSDINYLLSLHNLTNEVELENMSQGKDEMMIETEIQRAFSVKGNIISPEEARNRAWKVLQIHGIIRHDVNIPDNVNLKTPKIFRSTIRIYRKEYPVYEMDRKQFKQDTLTKAYRTVSLATLKELQVLYHHDLKLFDYDFEPDFIRNRDAKSEFKDWKPFSLF